MQPPALALGLDLVAAPVVFPAESARLRAHALARGGDPIAVWRAWLEERRRSTNALVRALARVDEAYRTDTPELLDRDDTPPALRARLVDRLDALHRRFGTYRQHCALVRPLLEGTAGRVLEIASGHGQLAIAIDRDLRAAGLAPRVTGSDYKPELVALARKNAVNSGSSATFALEDATRLSFPADHFDVAVNCFTMHHFPFEQLVRALAELRRVAHAAVIVDLARSPLLYAPGALVVGAITGELGCVHDGLLSLRKAWGVDEWQLAAELAGWERLRLGLLPPTSLVAHLARA